MIIKNIIKKLDLEKIDDLIKDGYIIRGEHPSGDLFIYNYGQKAVYENYWIDETLQCRGLIADKEGNIIARPFPKFFNLEEMTGNLPLNEPFEVFDKLDGSLGILYFYKGDPYIATRGSFVSEQAKVANEMLRGYSDDLTYLNPSFTYLFEIIYPENRIVVDYGKERSLTLLSIIETSTGEEYKMYPDNGEENVFCLVRSTPFPAVERFGKMIGIGDGDINNIAKFANMSCPNKEGFVIRFKSGLRIKIKFSDYVKLHSIVTQVTKKKVWEFVKDGKKFDEFINNIPDELYGWIKETESNLKEDYYHLENSAKYMLSVVLKELRPLIAKIIMSNTHIDVMGTTFKSILFSMLDNKDYSKAIWKMLEPAHEIPVIEGLKFYDDEH